MCKLFVRKKCTTTEASRGVLPWRVGQGGDAFAQWADEGYVDFVEMFDGERGLTIGIRREGAVAGDGFDRLRPTYGQEWELGRPISQRKISWLICRVLRPKGVHLERLAARGA